MGKAAKKPVPAKGATKPAPKKPAAKAKSLPKAKVDLAPRHAGKVASALRKVAGATAGSPKTEAAPKLVDAGPTPAISGVPPFLPHGSIVASPLNPRRDLDVNDLGPLAASIVANGLLQAILVRPEKSIAGYETGNYEIVAGERRWRAVGLAIADGRLAADYAIPVRLRDCTDAELVELAAVENIGRKDMHPLDEAGAIAAMRQFHKDDLEIARRLGIAERTFYRRVALLRLAPEIQDDLRAARITFAQAGAYALGEPAQQLAHRKLIESSPWMKDPEQIRKTMSAKRALVSTALFDLALYHGELIADGETDERYFADMAEFAHLQGIAVAARIDDLSRQYKWVHRLPDGTINPATYRDCPIADPDAGAAWYMDHQGIFTVKAPVLRPETVAARVQQETRDRAAAHQNPTDDPAMADRRQSALDAAGADPANVENVIIHQAAERDRLLHLLLDAMIEDPHAMIAAALAGDLVEHGIDDRETGQGAAIRAALDVAAPDISLEDIEPEDGPHLFAAFKSLPLQRLFALYAHIVVATYESYVLFRHNEPRPLALAILQRDLPLGETAQEQAAQ